MDKPRFIRGLLEEVGTAINPITLVQRIPEGLEIEGLREGLKHIMKEHEIQYSISEGVARVLRSEVAAAQATLRTGQRKGIKFEVVVKQGDHVDIQTKDVPSERAANDEAGATTMPLKKPTKKWKPGHCAAAHCLDPFTEWETDTLVGFACGHVFHLPHLLQVLHPDEPVPDVAGFGYGGGEDGDNSAGRVGTKVTHARLLRDRITGCPVCVKSDEVA